VDEARAPNPGHQILMHSDSLNCLIQKDSGEARERERERESGRERDTSACSCSPSADVGPDGSPSSSPRSGVPGLPRWIPGPPRSCAGRRLHSGASPPYGRLEPHAVLEKRQNGAPLGLTVGSRIPAAKKEKHCPNAHHERETRFGIPPGDTTPEAASDPWSTTPVRHKRIRPAARPGSVRAP